MITYNKPISPEDAKMIERLIESQVGTDFEGRVEFLRALGEEFMTFWIVGTSPLEGEINAQVRLIWRDL